MEVTNGDHWRVRPRPSSCSSHRSNGRLRETSGRSACARVTVEPTRRSDHGRRKPRIPGPMTDAFVCWFFPIWIIHCSPSRPSCRWSPSTLRLPLVVSFSQIHRLSVLRSRDSDMTCSLRSKTAKMQPLSQAELQELEITRAASALGRTNSKGGTINRLSGPALGADRP